MYPRNAATPPRIAIGAVVQISDGAVQSSGVSVVVRPEGGSETAGGGTVSYGASSNVVYYAPTQAETNYTAFVVTAYKTGCVPVSVTVVTTAESTAGKVSLGSSQTANITGNITGNLSGSVGSVTGNVGGNVAGSVGSVTGNVGGNVVGSVGSVVGAINTGSGTFTTLDGLYAGLDAGHVAIAGAVATIDGIVDAILLDTAEIGTAGAGLTALASAAELAKVPKSDGTVTWNATALASINAECDTALADYDAPTKAELDTAESNIRGADSDTLKTLSDQIDGISSGSSPQLLQNTTIATLASQTSFTLTAGSADDDAYNGAVAVFTDQSTSTQKAFVPISDYTGSTKTITLSAAPAFTIAVGDTIDIIAAASDAPTAAAIRAEIDSNSTQLAAILADTAEIGVAGAGLTEAGGTGDHLTAIPPVVLQDNAADLVLQTVTPQTITEDATGSAVDLNAIIPATVKVRFQVGGLVGDTTVTLSLEQSSDGSSWSALGSAFPTVSASGVTDTPVAVTLRYLRAQLVVAGSSPQAEVAVSLSAFDGVPSIVTATMADTNELQTDWADGGRLDLILDAILGDTGTDGVALSTATCQKMAHIILRRTMANVEASADGDTLSLSSLYGFVQMAQEAAVSSTTLTVKQTDGTTTLGTKTLATDAAADPITGVS